ncbi:hypothetical protein L2Y94_06690 [Luteibacter aegosomatis]|uniref:hypothetical protein n=1 Tax=Luteibacter aegosomatis TaxID=2911537 RepID=UPI001FF9039E|nr:hypothetical protein [Luteibacter aegosomatis]UPG87039.1 hypothetical protein L2Y94_06690 [Luteibacter aegosomatis]
MRRINTPDGLYHNADVLAGVQGTVVDADALNAIQEEIIAVITDAGMELDPSSKTQLRDAIAAITGAGVEWGAIKHKPEEFPSTIPLVDGLSDALGLLAPKSSPVLTGTPKAPTAQPGTSTDQIASTAFVSAGLANKADEDHHHEIGDVDGLQDALDAKASTLDLNGKVSKAGDTMTGKLTVKSGRPAVELNKLASGGEAYIAGFTNGAARWSAIFGDSGAESGADAGSDFQLQSYNDAGALKGAVLKFSRKTGDAIFSASILCNGFIGSNQAATVVYANAGTVYLRPSGGNSTAGQWTADAGGLLSGGSPGTAVRGFQKYGISTFSATSNSNTDPGIGGSYSAWAGDRTPALQVDAQNTSSAYMVWRVTKWGERHLAAMDVYYNGGNMRVDLHCGVQQTHWWESNGNFTATGKVIAIGGFDTSDIHEKRDVRAAQVTRGLSLRCAKAFKQWFWKANGESDRGLIAQWLRRHAPHLVVEYVKAGTGKRGDRKVKRLAINKSALALECSMDNALAIEELINSNRALQRRIDRLEQKTK